LRSDYLRRHSGEVSVRLVVGIHLKDIHGEGEAPGHAQAVGIGSQGKAGHGGQGEAVGSEEGEDAVEQFGAGVGFVGVHQLAQGIGRGERTLSAGAQPLHGGNAVVAFLKAAHAIRAGGVGVDAVGVGLVGTGEQQSVAQPAVLSAEAVHCVGVAVQSACNAQQWP